MELDDFTTKHLENWLQHKIREEDQEQVKASILALLDRDPALLSDHSWDELRHMAEGSGQLYAKWVHTNCKFAQSFYKGIAVPDTVPGHEAGKIVRELGNGKLPRFGYCQRLKDGRELCHDARGYYLVGQKQLAWNDPSWNDPKTHEDEHAI